MNTVKVPVLKLLETLKKNRATHIAEHAEAVKGYREKCITRMRENLTAAEAGGDPIVNLHGCYKPETHEKDYDRAISMLKWGVATEVELTVNEFEQYVNDEWQWQTNFKFVNSMCLSTK